MRSWRLLVRNWSVVLALLVLWGCPGGPSGIPDPGPDPAEWGRIEAGDTARSLGIARYDMSVSTTGGPRVRIVVTSREGARFGVVTMYRDGVAGLVAEYTGQDGDAAIHRTSASVLEAEPVFVVHTSLEARGRALDRAMIGQRDAASLDGSGPWVQSVVLSTILPLGSELPSLGGLTIEATGDRASLVVQQDGVSMADPAAVHEWAAAVGLTPLMTSPAATILTAIVQDPALASALEQRLGAMAPAGTSLAEGRRSEALHASPQCASVYSRLAIAPSAASGCCSTCDFAALATSSDFDPLDGLNAISCHCCAAATLTNTLDLLACLHAWTQTADHFDDARCQSLGGCRPGLEPRATADGHGCECICSAAACQIRCDEASARIGFPSTPACIMGSCECMPPTIDTFCRSRLGSDYCEGGSIAFGGPPVVIRCPNVRCGDGHRIGPGECADGRTEVCDGSAAAPGCAAGELCVANCLLCQACPPGCSTCRCTPDATPSGCPPDHTCNAECGCDPVPTCARSFVSLITEGRWCDPTEAGWCPEGTVCDGGTCLCTYCGDGVVNGAEECEEGFAGGECPAGQPCTDCRCGTNCGNGRRDPGEHCDPAGDSACDPGYSCSADCNCVAASCGDGICDRASGEGETCPGDCPRACGDGICNTAVGENTMGSAAYCPGDCPEVQCCFDTNGCPSEELYSCPGECCCCRSGARCVRPSGVWVCGI